MDHPAAQPRCTGGVQGRGLRFAVSPKATFSWHPSWPLAPAVPLIPSSSPLPFCPSLSKRFHLRILTLLASVTGFQVTSLSRPMTLQPDNPSLCPGSLPSSGSQAGGEGGGSRPPVLLPWAWQARWTSVLRNPTCGSVCATGFPLLRPGAGAVARCCNGSKQKAGLLKVATCS